MPLAKVGKYLKMKPQTIYALAQKGIMPAIKLGKECRLRRVVIDEWLNKRFHEKFKPILNKLDN